MLPGDVVRTPPGKVHGIANRGAVPVIYLMVTTPPEDLRAFYLGQEGP